MTKEDLQRVLLTDLGKDYDPLEALRFLRILENNEKNLKKVTKNLEYLLEDPPIDDLRLQIVYKTPYVLGEIVLGGTQTRQTHQLCNYHPIHFKKTYLQKLSRWETNPLHEAQQSHQVWLHFQEETYAKIINDAPTETINDQGGTKRTKIPLPLGACAKSFRSQIIIGKSLGSLSPIKHAGSPTITLKQILEAKRNYGSIIKLWKGLESLDQVTDTLHNGGFLHNDLHRENLLLQEVEGKLLGSLIDFETTEENALFQSSQWGEETRKDKKDLIKESCLIYLCASPKEKTQIRSEETNLLAHVLNSIKSDPLMIYLEKMLR